MPHSVPDDPPAPPRAESLATIAELTARLRSLNVSPPDAFVWTHRRKSRWWAFGRFGRYTVAVPRRFGWAVGDYPWEGPVHDRDGISSEVFVKPTYVDAKGLIAPLDATRALMVDNHLLTDEMCAEIAATMQQIAAKSEALPERDAPRGNEAEHDSEHGHDSNHGQASSHDH
jgi:hypothetical protein